MVEKKRVTEKVLNYGGREFKIKKMDARTASYLAFQLKSLIPMGNADGEVVSNAQSTMSRREFFSLQNDCLSACYHVEKAGDIPVLDEKNNFQDKDLAADARTVILLTINSLAFNVTDFFDAAFLEEFQTNLQSMMPLPA